MFIMDLKEFSPNVWFLSNIKQFKPVSIDLNQCEVTIGRGVQHDLPVNVSRNHALFKYEDGSWHITDLKSSNGVFINETRIPHSHRVKLNVGDIVGLSSPTCDHVYKLCKKPIFENRAESAQSYEISSSHECYGEKSNESPSVNAGDNDKTKTTETNYSFIDRINLNIELIEKIEKDVENILRSSVESEKIVSPGPNDHKICSNGSSATSDVKGGETAANPTTEISAENLFNDSEYLNCSIKLPCKVERTDDNIRMRENEPGRQSVLCDSTNLTSTSSKPKEFVSIRNNKAIETPASPPKEVNFNYAPKDIPIVATAAFDSCESKCPSSSPNETDSDESIDELDSDSEITEERKLLFLKLFNYSQQIKFASTAEAINADSVNEQSANGTPKAENPSPLNLNEDRSSHRRESESETKNVPRPDEECSKSGDDTLNAAKGSVVSDSERHVDGRTENDGSASPKCGSNDASDLVQAHITDEMEKVSISPTSSKSEEGNREAVHRENHVSGDGAERSPVESTPCAYIGANCELIHSRINRLSLSKRRREADKSDASVNVDDGAKSKLSSGGEISNDDGPTKCSNVEDAKKVKISEGVGEKRLDREVKSNVDDRESGVVQESTADDQSKITELRNEENSKRSEEWPTRQKPVLCDESDSDRNGPTHLNKIESRKGESAILDDATSKIESDSHQSDVEGGKIKDECVNISNSDGDDFFPILSQNFWGDGGNVKSENSSIKLESEKWLCKGKRTLKKKAVMINALPQMPRSKKRKFDDASDERDPNQQPVSNRDKWRMNRPKPPFKKSKKVSLKDKVAASYNYRVPMSGTSSAIRKTLGGVDDCPRVIRQVSKSETAVSSTVAQNKTSKELPKFLKFSRVDGTKADVKRLPDSATSRSDFLSEEIVVNPKKRISRVTSADKVSTTVTSPTITSTSTVSESANSSTVKVAMQSNKNSCLLDALLPKAGHQKKTVNFNEDTIKKRTRHPSFTPQLESKLSWSVESVISDILNFSTDILKTQSAFPVGSIGQVKRTKLCYESVDDYISTFTQLVAMEIFEQARQAWLSNIKNKFNVFIESVSMGGSSIVNLTCQALVPNSEVAKLQFYNSDGFLVVLNIPIKWKTPNLSMSVFGFTTKVTSCRLREEDKQTINPVLARSLVACDTHTLLSFDINCKTGGATIMTARFISLEIVDYIKPTLKLCSAMFRLKESPLIYDILKPRKSTFEMQSNNVELLPHNLNQCQADVVSRCYDAINHAHSMPKIMLIQGPPGTGKSYTIVDLIQQILFNVNDSRSRPRILLTAPSNAAIDELVRKLIVVKQKLRKDGSGKRIKLVRLGVADQIHPDVKYCSLDVIVKNNLENCKNKEALGSKDCNKNNAKHVDCRTERSKCIDMILEGANIIAATLSSCKHAFFDNIILRQNNPNFFTALIVDEACQCTEVELTIPLQYKISKLVLVGDPKQLPATVISTQAADQFNFRRSYFERVVQYFRDAADGNCNPVMMLKMQYRMHPEICMFPSRQFYDNELITCREMMQTHLPLKPYIVMDVIDTTEEKQNGNICNKMEAMTVVSVCKYVTEIISSNMKIGVITPYQQQCTKIRNMLAQKNLSDVEVNTVDGFQGRELDVVIVSCVRAKSASGTIGFLSDAKRLNVAITRAKYSLILCGDLHSLEVNPTWRALICDARQRGVKITTDQHFSKKQLMNDNLHQ